MFSNRSVRVQPSAPPIEYAGVPDALMVLAILRRFETVFGGLTPAVLKAGTLYQTSAVLAALKTHAYCLPLHLPRLSQPLLKFLFSTLFAYVIGLSLCWFANCLIVPGWAMSAMSGG